jgi:hypothetical protein
MVENDRIPLSLYREVLEERGEVVERALNFHALIGPVEQRLLAMTSAGEGDVRAFLRSLVAQAAAHYGETEELLGYRLPTECEVHDVASRVAPLLALRPAAGVAEEEWKARLFGAALSAVVRKRAVRADRSDGPYRRAVDIDSDGIVRERRDLATLAAGLGTPLLPDIQSAADGAALASWFPPEDWRFTREANGLATLANLVAQARIQVAPQPVRTLLVIRYFAVVSNGVPYRIRVWAGGRMLDEQLVVLQESRLVRGIVPADCAEIVVEIASDDARVDAPWRIRVGVCQLFALEEA